MDRQNGMSHVRNALEKDLQTQRWPHGVFGDTVGGKSFTDEQSSILERTAAHHRPVTNGGWYECWYNGTCWTLIDCRRENSDDIAIMREAISDCVGAQQ